MTWARSRSLMPIVLLVLAAACGGDASGTSATAGSPPPPSNEASPSPSPLVVPKDCSPDGSKLEISAVNTSWADSHGHPIAPGELCLAVAPGPFTVTLHNDVRGAGIGAPNHNFAVFADSSASDALFTGDLAYPGTSPTYHVPRLPVGGRAVRYDAASQLTHGLPWA